MTAKQNLEQKLDALGAEIRQARERLAQKTEMREEHHAAGDELWKRYEALRSELGKEISEDEAQGEHVTDFERSFRAWIDEIDQDG